MARSVDDAHRSVGRTHTKGGSRLSHKAHQPTRQNTPFSQPLATIAGNVPYDRHQILAILAGIPAAPLVVGFPQRIVGHVPARGKD